MREDVLQRYRSFARDYMEGLSRAELCSRYGVKEEDFDAFVRYLKRKGLISAVEPRRQRSFARCHEIDFEIYGDDMQFVEVELDPGESAVAEAGAMMYMDEGIEMETVFGDGTESGFFGKLVGAGKRLLTGESLFMTVFTNRSHEKRRVAFGAPFPGKIIPIDLKEIGGQIICQKDAFLCGAKGISIGVAFQKRFGAGLFGGEGFILEKIEGDGYVFLHVGGSVVERELEAGQFLRVDTGCLAAMSPTVEYSIEFVGGIKTALFGGEGLFFATLTGPGKVFLQSLPLSRLADRIVSSATSIGGKRRGEGSILGGLGDLLDGDSGF
jgi:uncharacterized protein (TIGR00266 family)